MKERIICLLIGYLFGCFMTAEIVTRKLTGKSARELGTSGNPGMANVMANLGFKAGITVLIGDLAKTISASVICFLLFGKDIGKMSLLYAGFGATIGHDFPFWMKFRGGKGVASSSVAFVIFDPFWGLIANIAGMFIVFATKYLCIGGVVIPVFLGIIYAFFFNSIEALIILISQHLHFTVTSRRSREFLPGRPRRRMSSEHSVANSARESSSSSYWPPSSSSQRTHISLVRPLVYRFISDTKSPCSGQ